MWGSRRRRKGIVRSYSFSPEYKLDKGYTRRITVVERVPKIDGFTMPAPRPGTNGSVADMELDAMFKAVLHRPSKPNSDTESMLQDPLEPYKLYHARPSHEDPLHPWSPNTAFSGSWYAYFPSVEALACAASRKLLARQEFET